MILDKALILGMAFTVVTSAWGSALEEEKEQPMSSAPQTETYRSDTPFVDELNIHARTAALLQDQFEAIHAVEGAQEAIASAVTQAVPRLEKGGRLIYVGAGTSGRLGVTDSAELYPTFGWPMERALFCVAGGIPALTRSVEGAEDSVPQGVAEMTALNPQPEDVVIGLSASGGAPYVLAALEIAKTAGALTIGVANSPRCALLLQAQVPVLLDTGGELVQGSTRLKAGTAQKVFLSVFSTNLMVELGYVYKGLMVNLSTSNIKLAKRRLQITRELTGLPEDQALELLKKAQNDNRIALLMHEKGLSLEKAQECLVAANGNLKKALESLSFS